LTASGGTGPYTWSIPTGSAPAGLALSPTGMLSGTPTVAGSFTFTAEARDVYRCVGGATVGITIDCPALALTPASLPSGYRGVAYSQSVTSSGGVGPYSYSLIAGSLPPGVTLSSAGVISGTPTAAGSHSFTVRAVDSASCSGTRDYVITISGLTLGDLVWDDLDQSGTRDVGEPGLAGVTLELFSTTDTVAGNGDDVSQGTTTTDGTGGYAFTGLAPGRYFVRISSPPATHPMSSGAQVGADNGIDDDNNGLQPGGKGTAITSPVVMLSVGREPGDVAGGGDADNSIDFGLRAVPASLANLLEYDLNAASGGLPAPPSFKNTCVVNAAKIQIEDDMNGLMDISEPTTNGPIRGGSRSRRMRDWDAAYDTAYDAQRTSLTQNRDSLWIRFDLDPTTTGSIGNLLFDVFRVGTTAPVQGKVFLTWKDGAEHHTAVTNTFSLPSTGSWYSLDLPWSSFIGGATAVPTGAQLAGKSFLLEIYLWGGDGSGYIDIDNILLQGSATCDPPTLSIGDFVWADTNGNGIKNPREPGLPGLTVELLRPGADNLPNTADDQPVAVTTTDTNGYYLFSGLPAGQYFVRIPNPDPLWPVASPAVNADNGVDNDSNGLQPGGSGTPVHSPVIDLALNSEPGSTGGGNQEMTIDFGFSASLSIGNLVWSDNNNNGVVNVGELGVEGAQVELFRSTDNTVNNGDDVKVGSTFTTAADGLYNFTGLGAGRYYVRVTPPVSHPRRSSSSSSSDNGIDNDNNGISQSSRGAPIYSPMITLSALTEPGNLVAPFGGNADNTIDFGLRPTFCSIGNLVYKDGNNNGIYDSGEGVGGVRVELLNSAGVFVASTTTSTSTSTRGRYIFNNVVPGSYYVRIPASEFAVGKPLVNSISIAPSNPGDNDLDDNIVGNDNGIDNAQPWVNGISSALILLEDDGEPTNSTGESGAFNTIDDGDDDNGNMTIDFGFKSSGPAATGCYHFLLTDTNRDGVLLQSGEITPGQAYDFNYTPTIAHLDHADFIYDAALSRVVLDLTLNQIGASKVDALWFLVSTGSDPATAEHAVVYFDGVSRSNPNVSVYRYDPALGHESWQNSANLMVSSAPGSTTAGDVLLKKVTETGSSVRFQLVLDVSRVNNAINWAAMGVDELAWEGIQAGGNAGIALRMVDLDSAPAYDTDGALTSFNYTPGVTAEGVFETDPAGVFTLATEPCSISPWVSIGNFVWNDANSNGLRDVGEIGISGATVQLFSPGADDAVGGEGENADTQVGASIVTNSAGAYLFNNLVPGKYYVRVTPPVSIPGTGGVPVALDNDVDNDNNGLQPGGPGTPLYSPVIDLQVGTEPPSAVDGDGTSGNNTIDFGLFTGITVGDLVWNDSNNNGLKDSTESGIGGVQVELVSTGADGQIGGTGENADVVVQTTSTQSNGSYSFRTYAPGLYYVRLTPPASYSLASSTVVTDDNAVNNDNNGSQPGGGGSEIMSMVFQLTAGGEPGSTGVTNTENTIDFGLRACPVITITPGALADVMRGSSYSATFNAAGGNSPYTWSIISGALPAGLSLSSAGVLSGTANASPATYSFTVRVRDSSNCSATQAMTLRVLCPVLSLSPTSLASVTQGSVVSQQFTASGGVAPYTYTRSSGTLPAGVSISSDGLLSGTITGAPGAYSFVIRATDANGCVVDNAVVWNITCPSLVLNPSSLPAATQHTLYAAQTLTTSAGTAPYQWSVSGTLPAGMSFSTSGVLSGTPTSAPGTYNVTISATDANGCAGSRIYGIVVNCPTISITAPALPPGTKGVEYAAQQLSASAGTAPYTWSLASGTLPAGLSLSNAGQISGTPSGAPATYHFTVRATDGVNCSATRALQIVIACPTLSIGPVPLPSAVQYASYSQSLAAGGGTAPYTWSLHSGVLPTGMTLSAGGVLSGEPTSLGSSTFVVRATDADGCSSTQSYTFTVDYPPVSILPPTLPDATRLVPYFQQITASGGTAPYTYSRLTGNLPSGITISSTGVISGTTTAAPGVYSFTVQALDANGAPGTQPYTITVLCPDFVITPSSLSNATVGGSYSASLNAVGGTAPYVWSVVGGALPAGLSLSSSGLISGTPTQAMTASFTIEARDAYDCAATRLYTLVVNCPGISITPATLPSAYYDSAYSEQLSASGGTGPHAWSVIAGTPPAGITLSTAGVLSGVPQVYGTASFTVRVTDAYNCSSTQSYSLLVKGLSLGDLVFEDTNFNGLRDIGEPGLKDVVVELWDPGADGAIGGSGPNSDLLLRTTTTGALGQYHFDNLQPGAYFVRVLMPSPLHISAGNPVNLDNGIDNDNNAALQPDGPGTPVFSPVITLSKGGEPVVDDGDPDTDFTLDFGLFRGMSVGNLVWEDGDDNGLRDPGEPGIDDVRVELWATGADGRVGGTDDVLLRGTTTANGGAYLFNGLPPLQVYVRIPVPPVGHPLASTVTVFEDNGIDNDNNGHQVSGGSVYSPVITLSAADEPGSGGGTYEELTVDFGFRNVAPTIYVSATQADSIQTFDVISGLYTGSLVPAFGNSQSQGNADWGDVPYAIEFGSDGHWYVAHYGASNLRKISQQGVDLGPVLDNSTASLSLVAHFAIGPDGNFYVVDGNGGRVVRFHGPASATPGAPIGAAPHTFISQNGIEDINFGPDGNLYLVVQTSALREVRRYSATTGEFLNTIVTDMQVVEMVPGGQPIALISGIDIHDNILYGVNRSDGEVFSVDLTLPAAPGLPQLIATLSSAGVGEVDTRDIEFNPASNQLFITGYNWGKPVTAGTYLSGALIRVNVEGAPNGVVSIHEVPIPRPPGPNNEIWSGPRSLAIGPPMAPLPESVAVGSLVWNDLDADGIQDADEPGIPGVRVELWRDANGFAGDGAEELVGWTFTDTHGHYYFSGQAPGVYQVRIPVSNFADGLPLAGSGYSSPLTSILDDQIDGDDSGRQPDGPKTVVYSPLITLTPGAEPLGNGTGGAENARGGELDNHTVDANGDMTIDFGFVEPGIMGIGNLVFVDDNGNNRFDVGEGRDDVTIELYRWGDVPGITPPVATTVTANGGLYLFSNLWQGQYFIHLPAPQFEVNGNLRGLFSLPVVSVSDDDVGQDALPTDEPWVTGISTVMVNLMREQAPTDDGIETGHDSSTDLDDFNINLTVDIGLFRPVALGNLVFADDNSNGHFDVGEGMPGVRVELYTDTQFPGVDNPLSFMTTDAQGRYGFSFLRPGNYIVHVPASQFQPGAPLYQRISILEGLVGDDDVGEDGINNGDPAVNGVSTLVVSLYPGNAPTDDSGETGFEHTSDNQIDAAVDLTIDFGFQRPVGVGNLVYIDQNENGFADVGEGVDGVTVELYRGDQTPGFGLPIFTRVTADGGRYFFDSLPAGDYRLHIPPSEFEPGRPLHGLESSPGVSSVTEPLDDNVPGNENGIDDPTPFLNGISSAVFTLAVDAEPSAADGETGIGSDADDLDDDNFNLTLDFGFSPSNPNGVGVGNLVYVDLNGNGVADAGEGIDGVRVQLFAATADPFTTVPLATQTTHDGGRYLFGNLAEGDYKVFIPPTEFAPGKPLAGWLSIPGHGGDNGIDDNLDENGIDSATPWATGISSEPFRLAPGEEPTNSLGEFGQHAFMDDVRDENTDLTIDFGFFRAVAVGNLVFIDANYNGRADPGEGVGGVTLELYEEGSVIPFDAPLATTVSESDGSYLFSDLNPGRYFIRIPAWQFDFGMPLYFHASALGAQTGDDHLGEDGIDDGNPSANGIQSAVFELTPTGAPVGSQEGGHLGSSDDLDDAAVDLTIDFGFVPQVSIGNLIFADANNDGIFDPNIESGVDGVTVELWSNQTGATAPVATTSTYGGGLYLFNVAPGSYHVRVPASNFAEGMALADSVPSLPAGASAPVSTAGDDDSGQDGYTTGSVLVEGVRTPAFTILPGMAPTFDSGETGYLSEMDDYADEHMDLTIDLGFSPKPLSVGNLVFRDLNENGHYDIGDFGVAGIKVRLFKVGDSPATSTPVSEVVTGIDGSFLLNAYEAGEYFMHIPASEFSGTSLLAGTTSIPGHGADDGLDDDDGENGIDAANPAATGVSSIVFELGYGTEPVDSGSETGFLAAQDAFNDGDADLTLDFGFTGGELPNLMSIGNLVFNDSNNNGVADAGEGVPGVWMLLYAGSGTAGSTSSIRSTFTDDNGRYLFNNLVPGTYTVHVAADNFKESISIGGGPVGPGPLARKMSLRGHQVNISDDNLGEDGIDVQNPEQVGITAPPVTLIANGAPMGAAESGFQGSSDDATDNRVNLTVDFGFATRLGVGNLVFRDNNADGRFQTGVDVGIAGITVELVHIDGVTSQENVVGMTTTNTQGAYLLYGPPALAPHAYKVRIPAAQFGPGGVLNFLVPSVLTASGSDDDTNQNALPTIAPEVTGVSTASYSATAGTQPTDADGRETGFNKTSDNADDANINLTFDFGLKPKAIMVGNLIFRDVNGNGTFESGIDLPVPGVTVRLFQQSQAVTATPVYEAVTAANGTYMLYATSPAAYYVHIPASMFAVGAPLDGLRSVTGLGLVSATTNANTDKDDRFDENGSDPSVPSAIGVSSGIVNLSYGGLPVNSNVTSSGGENGFEAFMDDAADSSGIMTVDFGFEVMGGQPLAARQQRTLGQRESTNTPAATFTAWQSQSGLSSLNHPDDDPDADGLVNLMEYALGTAPDNGLGVSHFRLVNNTTTGAIDALVTRPAGEHRDLRYILEGSRDFATWTTLALTPAVKAGADQTETLTFSAVDAAFTGASSGFLRLKVTLDADLDGTAESAAFTSASGWSRTSFAAGRQTLSMPLLLPAVYTGKVSSFSGRDVAINTNSFDIRTLWQQGVAYYAEVLDGTLAGRVFDIDTTASNGSVLAFTSAADANLAGARLRVRPHHTLGGLLPTDMLQPAAVAEEADRVMFFDTAMNNFQVLWLQAAADKARWTDTDGATDISSRIISPQTGMFVQVRATPVTLTFIGEVRAASLALPQAAGTHLLGTGFVKAQAPGSRPHTTGSRLRLWSGDDGSGSSAYQNYLLAPDSRWIDESTSLEVTDEPLLDAFRAFFLVK